MSAPDRIYLDGDAEAGDGYFTRCFETAKPCSEPAIQYVRADLCDPMQDARVTQLVDAAIAEDTAANKRVTSRERKQYIRGRIEALKDLRAALRDLEQGEP